MKKLENKVAVITGGNSGIGFATVQHFLEEGAKVVFSGRRQEALDEASAQLSGDFKAVLANQASLADNKRLIEEAVNTYGKIDVIFVNAGVAQFAPADQISEELFDTTFDINIKGPAFLLKEAIPHLNDGASVIFNTSIVHQKGFEGAGIYSATKGALRAYARVLTTELAPRKIRVNSIAPGPIGTPIYDKMEGMTPKDVEEMGAGFAASVPLKRFGESNEIASAAVFLASNDASFINGIELSIDGGLSQI
ncbi:MULTISPECIES: SDR family oxidoreductase [unclassified Aureispira]|uniref:SDR family oxidoreductase n=1 Tax=unclassified Aureispira TaxID=2649989 RepID=UPI000695B0FB|nr:MULTISPECIES: SDR family oxidoreductase [unclassified Aureispira]WMX15989.1 SDR family oxidoreductase [Aureispira sp. CCB-E]